ncbi:MAG TPA: MBL fold metallo-hydrolase [Candidatus Saccharimonadales bacterium]|nr:MBL fold metallo-hydrolase [Candidatus Saccharimonadales bacterium]
MDIEYKGANCITIDRKKDVFVIDPKLSSVGLKDFKGKSVAFIATKHAFMSEPTDEEVVLIDGPGEYEVKNCTIKGIAARPHSSLKDDDKSATMYKLNIDDTTIAIIGHVDPNLSDEQLEALGVVDILVVPVGGYGYTLDAKSAANLVKKIEPKTVIPTHYADASIKYEVEQAGLDEFVKELGGANVEEYAKLKVKSGLLPASLTIYKLALSK